MTTAQQRRFYFPKWQDCARANDWVMIKGRLLGSRTSTFASGEARNLYNAVWDAAEILSRQNHRAVTADDLRHACHLVALFPGKASAAKVARISSKDLNNRQLDRVIALFRVLTNPDDIAALIAWSDPSLAAKKRLEFVIRKTAPLAYIDAICRDKFGLLYTSPHWEELPISDLRQLAITLRNRAAAHAQPIDASRNFVHASNPNDPF